MKKKFTITSCISGYIINKESINQIKICIYILTTTHTHHSQTVLKSAKFIITCFLIEIIEE